uniref:Uncharacterized protein n=1 Tax=Branchiostoma floridae TaxID=7739 RepID=C3YSC8_BRAFL|eukprot:XP_002601021.1 hypothetical protein BRAFLDRAFT_96944 [Branchiostoma floridae]
MSESGDAPPPLLPELKRQDLELLRWLAVSHHGMFSRHAPLPRYYFRRSTKHLPDFDTIGMILAKSSLRPAWLDSVRPDGSLFYLEPYRDGGTTGLPPLVMPERRRVRFSTSSNHKDTRDRGMDCSRAKLKWWSFHHRSRDRKTHV